MNADDYIKSRAEIIEKAIYAEIPAEPKEVYGMLGEFISRGGKRIRPVLTLASCSACGGKENKVFFPLPDWEGCKGVRYISRSREEDNRSPKTDH